MSDMMICGVIWSPQKPDTLCYSAVIDGNWCYVESDSITSAIRAEGVRRGLSLGEMADFLNRQISNAQDRFRQDNRIPSVTLNATINDPAAFSEMFGIEWQPPIQSQVDGDTE